MFIAQYNNELLLNNFDRVCYTVRLLHGHKFLA
jgi:hypothetical protein